MYRDRADAGRQLAKRLLAYRDKDPVILALPPGGMPIGLACAEALGAPLDTMLVRSIRAPFEPSLSVGAIADGDEPEIVVNQSVKAALAVPDAYIVAESAIQRAKIAQLRTIWQDTHPAVPIEGRTVIVVDDGVSIGARASAALRAIRKRRPASTILAIPVASPAAIEMLATEYDSVVCLWSPAGFNGVSRFYGDLSRSADQAAERLRPDQPNGNELPDNPAAASPRPAPLDHGARRSFA